MENLFLPMICTSCLLKGISGMQFSMQICTRESQAACLAHARAATHRSQQYDDKNKFKWWNKFYYFLQFARVSRVPNRPLGTCEFKFASKTAFLRCLWVNLADLSIHGTVKCPIRSHQIRHWQWQCNWQPAETTTSDLSQFTTVLQRDIESKSRLFWRCPPVLIPVLCSEINSLFFNIKQNYIA